MIEYILGKKNVVVDTLSHLHNNGTQKTIHKYAYAMENMLEINDIKYLSEVTYPIDFKIIDRY